MASIKMGYGDWIMATSQVRQLNEAHGKPVYIVGKANRPMRSEVFDNNPRISMANGPRTVRLINGPGLRPYIESKTPTHWVWKKWDIAPGELFLTDDELSEATQRIGESEQCVMIEPNVKAGNANKAWLWDRWENLVRSMPTVTFVQTGNHAALHWLMEPNVRRVETKTFRNAAAVLANCVAFVGTEGALHHAAAAMNVPAVVLFSEFISPEITGYAGQVSIRHADAPCGCRIACAGCERSMQAISVAEVESALRRIL